MIPYWRKISEDLIAAHRLLHKTQRYFAVKLPRRHINFVHVFCVASVTHLNTEYVDEENMR